MNFRDALQSEKLALSAELTLRSDSSADDVHRQVEILGRDFDGIQVTDNPYAWVQMSALTASILIKKQGLDPVPVLTCRDRNRSALQREITAMKSLGVSNLMLMRGRPIVEEHAVSASTVFDVSGREIIDMAAREQCFHVGTGVRIFRPQRDWRAESLGARGSAGAEFLISQLCYNLDILRIYMHRFRKKELGKRFAIMISLAPFPSATVARWLKKTMSDSRIPESIIKRLEEARNPESEGIRICVETMQEIAEIPGIAGINLMTTGNPDTIPAVIKAAGLRS